MYNAYQQLVVALYMKSVVTVCEAIAGIFLADQPIKVANSWYIYVSNQAPLK
jgi:hypothetical protein